MSRSLAASGRAGQGRLVVLSRVLTPQKGHEVSEGVRKVQKDMKPLKVNERRPGRSTTGNIGTILLKSTMLDKGSGQIQ